ncbi:MAG TPA: transferrin-binding protein-like solute binding protein [Burkholderiales bacterium]|nr:transferrin-binding protein-like solute binding protein [Burkholderiales bacterium]
MKKLVVFGALALLGGCHAGTGTGSSSTNGPTVSNFMFSTVQAGQTVTLQGMSTVVTGTLFNGTVASTTPPATDTAASTATLTYDSTLTLTALTAATPAGSITFNKGLGDTFNCNAGVCGLTNGAGTASMIVIDPVTLPAGWNYQTFGVWERAGSVVSFDAGVFSVGNPTPGSAVPTTGSGNFTGLANGFFIDATNNRFFTTANMTASANFASQSIVFTTTNTQTVNISNPSGLGSLNPGLDLTGSFTYPAGTNLFTGTVASANGMNGTGTGRFYGPAAQEIGGMYSLSGAGIGQMIGSFGGKQ